VDIHGSGDVYWDVNVKDDHLSARLQPSQYNDVKNLYKQIRQQKIINVLLKLTSFSQQFNILLSLSLSDSN